MVPLTGGVRPPMCKMAHSSGGSVCHQIQPQAPAVRVSGSGSDSFEGGCVESSVGGAGCLCLSSSISPRPGGLQGSRPWLPMDDSDSQEVRIEAPQRHSTRGVYELKWYMFVKWDEPNQVDLQLPSIKQIVDFGLYLFQERHLQPSTIDGYRTALADKIGNDKVNISKEENLTGLLDSFHRDKPKGRRGVPTWNLSLVLQQLTKAPFEPLRKASLKHLILKTIFLLALGSGKRRNEIHAWLHKNIQHQEDWSNVSFLPSQSFFSKNQLAREGPSCVAPVIKSLKEHRTLPSMGIVLFGQNQGYPTA